MAENIQGKTYVPGVNASSGPLNSTLVVSCRPVTVADIQHGGHRCRPTVSSLIADFSRCFSGRGRLAIAFLAPESADHHARADRILPGIDTGRCPYLGRAVFLRMAFGPISLPIQRTNRRLGDIAMS
jgi:hypothetical protein